MIMKGLYDGTTIDLVDPRTYVFKVEPIATMLEKIKRFNGFGISVGSHSCMVARVLYEMTGNPHIALRGLMHDAHEAFIGDVSTPVKRAMGTAWEVMENRIQDAIEAQLCPKSEHSLAIQPLVALADAMLLKAELKFINENNTVFAYDTDAWAFLAKIPNLPLSFKKFDLDNGTDTFIAYYYRFVEEIAGLNEQELVLTDYHSPSGVLQCYVKDGYQRNLNFLGKHYEQL